MAPKRKDLHPLDGQHSFQKSPNIQLPTASRATYHEYTHNHHMGEGKEARIATTPMRKRRIALRPNQSVTSSPATATTVTGISWARPCLWLWSLRCSYFSYCWATEQSPIAMCALANRGLGEGGTSCTTPPGYPHHTMRRTIWKLRLMSFKGVSSTRRRMTCLLPLSRQFKHLEAQLGLVVEYQIEDVQVDSIPVYTPTLTTLFNSANSS